MTTTKQKSKVRGTFLGIAIGDALGLPVESFSKEKTVSYLADKGIAKITEYLRPDGHKWFDGHEAGEYTDDTQLSLALAKSLSETGLDLDSLARFHVEALNETDVGWGPSTRNSVRNLANGTSHNNSASGSGRGNGVAMKISPLALYFYLQNNNINNIRSRYNEVATFMGKMAAMTHKRGEALASALAQFGAVGYCLAATPKTFSPVEFRNTVVAASREYEDYLPDYAEKADDDISLRLSIIYPPLTEHQIIDWFDGGTSYCYNSIPFTMAFFVKNHMTIESMYDVVSAGGDTDTNGSMLGAMLGALHGEDFFPQHLIDGLKQKTKVLEAADNFYQKVAV